MNSTFVIGKYELKMQLRRWGGWIVWLLVSALAAWDCWPSARNFQRLSDLGTPAYFVVRILGQPGLELLFGLMFLISGRVPLDRKLGVKQLFMASPLRQAQYVLGKWAGNGLYMLLMFAGFLLVHVAAYALLGGAPLRPETFGPPLVAGVLFIVLPACLFMATCATCLPVWCDIRLCDLALSAFCMLNIFTFGSEMTNPFFQITFGVLTDQVFDNPFLPAAPASIIASNVAFLLLVPALVAAPALLRRGFWRGAE